MEANVIGVKDKNPNNQVETSVKVEDSVYSQNITSINEAKYNNAYRLFEEISSMFCKSSIASDNISTGSIPWTEDDKMNKVGEKFLSGLMEWQKTSKTLARLQEHLLELETQHTDELLQYQRQIEDINHELTNTRMTLRIKEDHEKSLNTEVLIAQLESANAELADTRLRLEESVEERENLSSVLESYEMTKKADIDMAVGSLKGQLLEANAKLSKMEKDFQSLKDDWDRLGMGKDEIEGLKQDRKLKNQTIEQLKKQVTTLSVALSSNFGTLKPTNDGDLIDKKVISNMLSHFLNAPEGKEDEMLVLLTRVLDMSDEQRTKVSLV